MAPLSAGQDVRPWGSPRTSLGLGCLIWEMGSSLVSLSRWAVGRPLPSQLPFLPAQHPQHAGSAHALSGQAKVPGAPSQVASGCQQAPPRSVIWVIKRPWASWEEGQRCLWRLSLC